MAGAFKIEQFTERVLQLQHMVEQELPVINVRLAKTAFGFAEHRIVQDGVRADGSSLGKYSEHALPAFFFTSGGLGSGADAKAKSLQNKNAKNGIHGISYKDWREVNGLQTDHVDLQFTGQTWRDFDVLGTESTPTSAITIVASKNSFKRKSGNRTIGTAEIADYNAERYGDYLEFNEQEKAEIELGFDAELQNILDNVFE